ncbi:Hsp20/alpha crystallin family protein [Lederbergia panacisoli]|uniref:Hsp20/alpha crystallin family protein n=1 Tax=Lederbergia panacisoli TaxID=1255251 RepID=UPI00214CE41A|nr:Hsp20/alpha crystallin family protein [Lederbergia panacisoli]MCR2822399.1 Hsp20/alpha crystallin family protein [Lederbergia panacisoli]
MDFDKLKQWMELAQKYQSGDFWNNMMNQSSFGQFMNDSMDMSGGPSQSEKTNQPQHSTTFPKIDIYITDTEVTVIAELAGYEKENLHISVSGNKLLLKGTSTPIIMGQPVLQERNEGQFQRIIELPEPTFSNQIRAKLQNGLLILTYKRKYFQEERVPID